ncbi:hypothetical protein E4K65_23680 [Bradyrhizobium niftali]|uniref:Uncharacterized protein n=1 Tax=Bradyrhizobium niftali TaxID=2560055 RepID=A0A4Y9LQ30_9BRAD|nr:hypothetical protein E4K65_23680 [Bradyrhizobium niftali]
MRAFPQTLSSSRRRPGPITPGRGLAKIRRSVLLPGATREITRYGSRPAPGRHLWFGTSFTHATVNRYAAFAFTPNAFSRTLEPSFARHASSAPLISP